MRDFDKWLFEVPWRLERYYDMVPGMTDEERKNLEIFFSFNSSAPAATPTPLWRVQQWAGQINAAGFVHSNNHYVT